MGVARSGEYLTTLYGTFEGDGRYSLVLAESADGFRWRLRAQIAGADCPLEGGEGPCESALCRLADGRIEPDSRKAWAGVEEMRRTGVTGFSSCYAELMALDERTLVLVYDRIGFGWAPIPDDSDETKSDWVMRLQIET
ncbi:MAG: hypothetical protein FJ290_23710 [Planctomycetes bacterium]|nr:hypothetical protein [Planctomycetota bacterium]